MASSRKIVKRTDPRVKEYCRWIYGTFEIALVRITERNKRRFALELFKKKEEQLTSLNLTDVDWLSEEKFEINYETASRKVTIQKLNDQQFFLQTYRGDSFFFAFCQITDDKIFTHNVVTNPGGGIKKDYGILSTGNIIMADEWCGMSARKIMLYDLTKHQEPLHLLTKSEDTKSEGTIQFREYGLFKLPDCKTPLHFLKASQVPTNILQDAIPTMPPPLTQMIREYTLEEKFINIQEGFDCPLIPMAIRIPLPEKEEEKASLKEKISVYPDSQASHALEKLVSLLEIRTDMTVNQCIKQVEKEFPAFQERKKSMPSVKLFISEQSFREYDLVRTVFNNLYLQHDPKRISCLSETPRPRPTKCVLQ